ncbi:hypothetical protein SCB29_31575, partial [Paraburkholderia sp. SIMBA_055]
LSLLTFFAAAKKVSAAPHRGNANRPQRNQGKAKGVKKSAERQNNPHSAPAQFVLYFSADS